MKIVAIIQARMSSSRLPGKVMADIHGVPMLTRVFQRVTSANLINYAIVATSLSSDDDEIYYLCKRTGIECFRGNLHDVLDRYYKAAVYSAADIIVRITADCPLIDPRVIDKVIKVFSPCDYDYVSNTITCTYPDGLDTEVFGINALEVAWKEAKLKSEREHVTPYIYNHPDLFRLKNVYNEADLSALRWTVDEASDLDFVRAVYGHLNAALFSLDDVIQLIERFPSLSAINSGIKRNEGYIKSLQQDTPEIF